MQIESQRAARWIESAVIGAWRYCALRRSHGLRLAEGLELGDLIVTDPNEVGPLHPGKDGNIKQLGHLADKPHALSDTP